MKIKSEAELYRQESPEEAWRLNALRARMDNDSEIPIETLPGEGDQRLISLKEIMLDTKLCQEDESHEAYIMLDEEMETREDHVNSKYDQTLIVKRASLLYNDKTCVVLHFKNITAIKHLKREEEKTKLMSALYASVHHEMIGPMKSTEEAAVRLIRKLKDNSLREQAQVILICNKQVLLHANDLLDQKLLQNGQFTPSYRQGSLFRAISEIVRIASMTIQKHDIDVVLDLNEIQDKFPSLSFDKRRL